MRKDIKNRRVSGSQQTNPKKKVVLRPLPLFTRENLFVFSLLLLFSFVLYGNTIGLGYVLDDKLVITDNKFTTAGINGLDEIFTRDSFLGVFAEMTGNWVAGGRYRPLSVATFAMEWEFFGPFPALSHVINILLYGLTGIFIFRILKRLLPAPNGSWWLSVPFITSLLFLAHPVHTEVVANIKGRDEIFAMLGAFMALHFYLNYIDFGKVSSLVYGFFCFFLSLLSKENAIAFAGIIPLTIFFFRTESNWKDWRVLLSLAAAVFFFLLLRMNAIGAKFSVVSEELMNNPFLEATGSQKFATIFYTLLVYLRLLFFPHPLTNDYYPYHIPLVDWADWQGWLSFLVMAAMGVYGLMKLKKRSLFSYSILFYLGTLFLVSNLVFPVGTFMAERLIYMPSFGFCLVLAYFLFGKLPELLGNHRYVPVGMAGLVLVVLLLFTGKTMARNLYWSDDYTLLVGDVAVSSGSAKSNYDAGLQNMNKGLQSKDSLERIAYAQKAIPFFQKATEIHKRYWNAWFNLGQLYEFLLQDIPSAARSYEKAHEFNPYKSDLSLKLAFLYGMKLNNVDKGIVFAERSFNSNSKSADAAKILGTLLGMRGQFDLAAQWLERSAGLNPNDPQTFQNLTITYQNLGDKEKSEQALLRLNQIQGQTK